MRTVRLAAAVLLVTAWAAGQVAGQDVDDSGTGWVPTRIDLAVTIRPELQRLEIVADLVLRLEGHERSRRLILVTSSRDSIVTFDSVATERGELVALDARIAGRPSARAAHVRFPGPPPRRGDVVRVRAHASGRGTTQQFTVADDVALASWVTAWYPVPLPADGRGLATVARAPGDTRFDVPAG